MAQELISHKVLSLDFWQDTVTYAGSVMPTGTIGCAVLNIPDETITRLDAPCMILNQLLTGIGLKNVDMQLLPKAQEAGRAIIHELRDVQPFSHLDRKQFEDYLTPAFSEEAFAELNNYLQLSMEQQALSGVMGTQPLAALLIRVIPVLGHLSYSLRQYKMTLTAFAEFLQENAEIRTPIGYAAAVYLYRADNDGEWGEIRFDFENGTAEIVKLADWDTIKSNVFAKTAIRYVQSLPEVRMLRFVVVPFESETLGK